MSRATAPGSSPQALDAAPPRVFAGLSPAHPHTMPTLDLRASCPLTPNRETGTLGGMLFGPPPAPPDPYPHPIISEVLFAVPTEAGDANRDGRRHATGDEFVELVNWTDAPINLKGYTLTDRNAPEKGQFKFVFPAFELPPGGVVVVFNGLEQKWSGPVGDDERPPTSAHPDFGDAWVFTARNDSDHVGFGNGGDWILLTSPTGEALSCLIWGDVPDKPPIEERLLNKVEVPRGCSVQRDTKTGEFVAHIRLGTKDERAPMSPGVFPWPRADSK